MIPGMTGNTVTVTVPIKQLDEQGLSVKTQAFADWLTENGLRVVDASFRYITLAAVDGGTTP